MSGINIPVTVTGADTAAAQLGKVSGALGGVGTSTDKANDALKNIGKTIKDIPGGFDAIGNNVKPLAQSLGGLVTETGSVKGAFAALATSLAGPAGVGIAIAIASTGFKLLVEYFSQSKVASEEAAKKLADFNKGLKEAEAGALATGAKLQAFANVAADQNVPLEQRNNALREANKLLGDHGEKLTLVTVGTAAATQRINEYTNALTARAVAEKFANRIAELRIQQIEANRQYEESLKKVADQEKRTRDLATSNVSAAAVAGQANLVQRAADQSKSAAQNLQSINKQIEVLNSDFRKVILESTKVQLLKENDTKTTEAGEQIKKKVKKIKEVVKKAVEDEKIGRLELPINIQILTREDAAADIAEANRIAKEKQDRFDKLFKNATPIKLPVEVTFDKIGDFAKKAQEFAAQAGDIIGRSLGDAFSGIGEAIGNIITGKGGAGDLFGGIFKVLGDGLKTLGNFVIQSAILLDSVKKVLNSILSSPGGFVAGIALGIALITLGTVISNSIPGFANGVTNFGGGMALVGERGPELVRLPSGSDVIPNFRLNSLSASQPTAYIPNVTLRGSDLVIAFNRQTATNRRNG
jgi:uncharacterized protein (UPF0216 family)